ncbi:MAG: hypothetical protein LAT50_20365 [Ectothiorhodospiraceae bacterium]|nr:hypothetical protein [Ectothiorhodospiraceae bacterium]
MNNKKINAVFDGQSLQLESPLNLAIGTRVQITVETLSSPGNTPKTFLQTAKSLQLQGDPDWSETIDRDLYGDFTDDPG